MQTRPTQPAGGRTFREGCSTTPSASAVGFCMEVGMEEWRAVAGYEGRYEVSNQGRVRSLLRDTSLILKQFFSEKEGEKSVRYLRVGLCDNGSRLFRVHRLVLEAFHGPCPAGLEGAHLDGDPTNNESTNLIWATRSENHLMRRNHGTSSVGERGSLAKLTWEQATDARSRVGAGETIGSVARDFGVDRSAISQIIRGITWKPELRNLPVAVERSTE